MTLRAVTKMPKINKVFLRTKSAAVSFFKKYKTDILCFLLLSFLSPLYFYKLAQSSLGSWDEAWYADIARNILERGDMFVLWWNDRIYSDHPPAGFWIIAFFQSLFGFNEFGARIGSAIFGMVGVFLVYLLGREMFSKVVGFSSALALSSTYWYLTRSRSGNLDIFLTVFFVLTFYLAIKSSKNPRFLIPFGISFGMLILTKAVIPFTIIPALLIIFFRSKFNLSETIKALVVFALVTLPWFVIQYRLAHETLEKYFQIGTAGVGEKTDYLKNFKQIKEYLHFGVGKWFWPGALGILAGPFTLNKYSIALSVFCLSFFLPFITSERGQIWHLIPLFPFMVLSFFGFLYTASNIVINKFFNKKKVLLVNLVAVGLIGYSIYFSWMQIKRSWYEFIDIPKFISDEAILSKKAGEFPQDFYIDGADFTPVAVFYSHKKRVEKIWEEGLKPLFDSDKKFVMITQQYRLDKFNIGKDQYEIIATDRDKILILRK